MFCLSIDALFLTLLGVFSWVVPTSCVSLDQITLADGCACQRRSWNTPTNTSRVHKSCNLLIFLPFFFLVICACLSSLGKVLAVAKNLGVLEAKLEEAKKQQQQREGGDKFVEIVEPFLARSKVGSPGRGGCWLGVGTGGGVDVGVDAIVVFVISVRMMALHAANSLSFSLSLSCRSSHSGIRWIT